MRASAHPAEKLVGITFDDGYQDFHTIAFPILSRYGYSATVFLPTAYIGEPSRQFKGAECLTWSQVRELRKAGVEFGSHTVTHPQLRGVSTEQMRMEVGRSKDDIEEKLGERVEAFAYPYAFPETDAAFVATLRSALQDSGYRSGVTTAIGRAATLDNAFFMRRLPVNSQDDPGLFQAKLEGGYDWLHGLQLISKHTQRHRNSPRPPGTRTGIETPSWIVEAQKYDKLRSARSPRPPKEHFRPCGSRSAWRLV